MSSLEKLCIDFIVRNFDLFYYAFSSSKDRNLQRNFEFLKRRFSEQLANALYENKNLKEEYFEFLINEHLNFIDGKWFRNSSYVNSMDRIFCRLPNLERVLFSTCGDEILEYIAQYCPKIIEIDVRHSNVTDTGIEYLCKIKNGMVPCPEIKSIFAWPSRVTSRGAERLVRSLPSLEKIDYNVPLLVHRIHEENLSRFGKVHFYNLVELNLLRFKRLPIYSDILRTCLAVCPKLQSFSCYVSNKEELALFNSRQFKKLHLQFSTADPSINIDDFLKKNGWNLTYLKISSCAMSVSVLAMHCPVIKEFYAHRVNFVDNNYNFKPVFPSLTECTFSDIEPSAGNAVCLFISSSPVLRSISFTYCTLSHELQSQILLWCKNPSAKKIEFWCLDLELDFLRNILLSCPSLKDMAVTECSVDVPDTKEILHRLARSLPNKPKIVFVQMYFNR